MIRLRPDRNRIDPFKPQPKADPTGQHKLHMKIHLARANAGKSLIHIEPGTFLSPKDVQKAIDRP